MIRRPPRSTRTDTLFPYTTLFRSVARRDTLDAFRFLMSAGNVPLVVAGLDVARQIFADDVELAYRSIILKLQLWEPGEPAQRLIRALRAVEGRVGKGCVGTGSIRWLPCH